MGLHSHYGRHPYDAEYRMLQRFGVLQMTHPQPDQASSTCRHGGSLAYGQVNSECAGSGVKMGMLKLRLVYGLWSV